MVALSSPYRARVAALREELRRRKLKGFLIPHADEYQNEYLPPSAERLAWLTGFTGSAGMAVVLQDRAAIFVDGRYTLQVQNEVDTALFTICHLLENPVPEWLGSILAPGDRIGYDPWLHTAKALAPLRASCEKAGGELVACETNPLDAIWTDRPSPPLAPVVPHDIRFAGKPADEKRLDIAHQLKSDGVDAVVLTAPDSIAWLFNVRGGDVAHTPLPLSYAVFHVDGTARLFLDERKVTSPLSSHLGPNVVIVPPDRFAESLDDLGARHAVVLCDGARSPSWVCDRLVRAGARVVEGEDPCVLPKACKNPTEVQGAREAHRRDGAAVCQFLSWLSRESLHGLVTELQAQAYLERCRQAQPLWQDASFPTISGAGANGAIIHYRSCEATNRRLEPGMLYLVDSGAQYLNGTTDITRTLAIGTPSSEQQDRYTRVLKGHIALATARFPKGITGGQLDALARGSLWAAGLDYDHGTGHGVGSYLGVHEGPQRIAKRPDAVALRPGMILSNEPGYYQTGAYGIRIENLMVVVPCRDVVETKREWLMFETLTLVPLDRHLMARALLSNDEVAWINAYHKRVCETVHPLVDAETAEWLVGATLPL